MALAADAYPNKPIRLIIPFPAGGTTDIVGRAVADKMGRELGVAVVVDNRGGGGGSIGADAVAHAPADGYTIGMATVSTHAVNPACNPKLSYDPLNDFKTITNLVHVANVIAVNPNFPAKDYKSFVATLKANPGKYSYATSGTCGIGHMLGEQYKVLSKTYIVHIPYRGAGPALNDVLAGQVPIFFDNLPSSMPSIKSGRLTPILVAWKTRLDSLPNVPTFAEVGLKNANDPAWYGLVAPVGVPDDMIKKLHDATVKALQDPGLRARMAGAGATPVGNTPQEFAAEIKNEYDKMKNLVKLQNIKLEQ
ncbi:MAG: tripartite tricarboxylate transporter substrate binding protein BugE [Candidatus Protistobacter heckmanni]|nr:tripartite tricarboxylate transporter substrate binding protein BugE [Candidatus Protistobacter heckmanni]